MLFQNMILEIRYHFLYGSSELIFEELEKLIWTELIQ